MIVCSLLHRAVITGSLIVTFVLCLMVASEVEAQSHMFIPNGLSVSQTGTGSDFVLRWNVERDKPPVFTIKGTQVQIEPQSVSGWPWCDEWETKLVSDGKAGTIEKNTYVALTDRAKCGNGHHWSSSGKITSLTVNSNTLFCVAPPPSRGRRTTNSCPYNQSDRLGAEAVNRLLPQPATCYKARVRTVFHIERTTDWLSSWSPTLNFCTDSLPRVVTFINGPSEINENDSATFKVDIGEIQTEETIIGLSYSSSNGAVRGDSCDTPGVDVVGPESVSIPAYQTESADVTLTACLDSSFDAGESIQVSFDTTYSKGATKELSITISDTTSPKQVTGLTATVGPEPAGGVLKISYIPPTKGTFSGYDLLWTSASQSSVPDNAPGGGNNPSMSWVGRGLSDSEISTRSAEISGLNNNVEYRIRVRARSTNGVASPWAFTTGTPKATLDTPTITTVEGGFEKMTANWGEVTGANNYTIQYQIVGKGYWTRKGGQSNLNRIVIPDDIPGGNDLNGGETYQVRVKAQHTNGDSFESGWSGWSSATVKSSSSVTLSSSTTRVHEGQEVVLTATLSKALSEKTKIPLSGRIEKIIIPAGQTTGKISIPTEVDDDADQETVTFSFGDLPEGIRAGTTSSIEITVTDNPVNVSISVGPETVREGGSVTIKVLADRAFQADKDIPVIISSAGLVVSNIPYNITITIPAGFVSGTKVVEIPHQDFDYKQITASLGNLPEGLTPETSTAVFSVENLADIKPSDSGIFSSITINDDTATLVLGRGAGRPDNGSYHVSWICNGSKAYGGYFDMKGPYALTKIRVRKNSPELSKCREDNSFGIRLQVVPKGYFLNVARPTVQSYDNSSKGRSNPRTNKLVTISFPNAPARQVQKTYSTKVSILTKGSVRELTCEGAQCPSNEYWYGSRYLDFHVNLSQASTDRVAVPYETRDGSVSMNGGNGGSTTQQAKGGSTCSVGVTTGSPGVNNHADYISQRGSLIFEPGETQKTVRVEICDDTHEDSGETFWVAILDPIENASRARGPIGFGAYGQIFNHDPQWNPKPLVESQKGSLTATFAELPIEHDGLNPFTLNVRLNTEFDLTSEHFDIQLGKIKQLTKVEDTLWSIQINPKNWKDVGVALTNPPVSNVEETNITIQGPVRIRVDGARAKEGVQNSLDFKVTLNRVASNEVSVDYETASNSAAEDDYVATQGTLVFAIGETEKTVSVPIIDDSIDEGKETMNLLLSNPKGAYLRNIHKQAKGEIRNSDPLPKEWVVHFGRTVGDHITSTVSNRLQSDRLNSHVVIAGHPVGMSQSNNVESYHDEYSPVSMSMREFLLGSSFNITSNGENENQRPAIWGQVTQSNISSTDKLNIDGKVITGTFGIDRDWGRTTAGLSLNFSEGKGTFNNSNSNGTITSNMTVVSPYMKYKMTENLSVWGLVGAGKGSLEMTESITITKTDLSLQMGAVGAYGNLLTAGEIDLAIKSDAMFVRTKWDQISNETETSVDSSRYRLIFEGSSSIEMSGGMLRPSLEFGVRYDDGDAGSGTGTEVGGGITYSTAGMSFNVNARKLLTHTNSNYNDWGMSIGFRHDPDEMKRGLSLSATTDIGVSTKGTNELWNASDIQSLESPTELTQTTNFTVGYGLPAFKGHYTGTPNFSVQVSDNENREYKIGYSLASIQSDVDINFDVMRREAMNTDPRHSLMLGIVTSW